MSTPKPAKRAKKAGGVDVFSIFNKETFEQRQRYADAHRTGAPYPHVRVEELFNGEALRAIVREAKEHLETDFKETDLFKMFQTLDLANFKECDNEKIMALRAKVPTIVKLRDALYSAEFRAFVRAVCGVEMELTERVDMAMQAYSEGGHLLCHDDVIGTRAVSFIIYLTDPDVEWTDSMGGELELYATENGLPANLPAKTVPPTSNTMVMFKVTPGVTFHAVSETLTDETPRLSLQGWFHAPAAPKGAEELSSISMLKDLKKEPTRFAPLACTVPEEGVAELAPEDRAALEAHVSPEYLKADQIRKIRERFADGGSVVLRDFLKKPVAEAVLAECAARDAADGIGGGRKLDLSNGVGKGMALQGSPVTQRYVRLRGSGMKIEALNEELMKSAPMTRYVALITGLRPLGAVSEVRRFRAGGDYTVAYHKMLEPDTRLDTALCFVADSDGWVTGDIGGYECFIAAETSELVAAEQYGDDEDAENELVNITPHTNTFSLVARDEQMMRFVKYVAASAPGSRWDISSTYEIQCDDESEEEEEEEPGR